MVSASREQNSSAGALEAEQLKMDHRVTAQSPPSDNDSGERPVRQQLKETNLDSVGEKDGSARANRKRSFDNTDGANDTPPTKRSRECTPDNNSNHAGIPKDATTQDVSDVVLPKAPANTSVHNTPLSHDPIMSHIPETKVQFPLDLEIKVSIAGSEQISHLTIPVESLETTAGGNEDESSQTLKKKRSREQLEDDASKNSHTATDPAPGLTETTSDEKSTAEGQPEKKRPRDNSEERKAKVDQTFTASAFGKASAAPSPFAMPGAKSTSDASPFATSGASTTGFGALGSGFSAFGSAFPPTSGKLTSFASPNAPTAFSGTAGKLTSFASANAPTSFSGTAGKLTSFASPNSPVGFDKTLGADQSDNEECDNGEVGEPDDGTFVAEKTDRRFHAQPVETGEENESTEFAAKGKLYYFDDKKWKERGTGTFKLNLKTESNGKKSARIIMRADGALRVMLNSAVWHTMPFGDAKGSRPTTRDIYLASNEDERVVSLLLRLGNEKQSGELFDVLKDIMEKN